MCDVEMLSVAAVAKRIDKSPNYVYAEIKSGRLRAIDLSPQGSRRPTLKVPANAVDPWIQSLVYVPNATLDN